MAKKKQRAKTNRTAVSSPANSLATKLPFIEHLFELRRRLVYIVVSVLVWSGAAYAVEHQITNWLLAPSHGEKFVYTSVGGGLDFLFRVCLYTGIVMSIPVIIYQSLRYVEPLIGRHATRFIMLASAVSGFLALAGIVFGYYLGLPAALQFLLHQFHTSDITALVTIQSYLSFVIVYLVGSSLIFQVPLVIFLINRIKPLKLQTLWKYERWVVVISLISAAAINPSPRFYDMGIIAVPMILSYQIGLGLVWYTNRGGRLSRRDELARADAAAQAERQSRLKTVEYVFEQAELAASLAPLPTAEPVPVTTDEPDQTPLNEPTTLPPRLAARPHRSSKYLDGFIDLHAGRHLYR